jgi:hypothetical protein
MEHDIEGNRGFLHFKKGLEKDEMAGTADGQEFCEPLNDSEKDSLEDIDLCSPLGVLPGQAPKLVDFEISI